MSAPYLAVQHLISVCWVLPHMASNKEKAFGEIRSLTTRAWGVQEQRDETRAQKGVENCDSGWPAPKTFTRSLLAVSPEAPPGSQRRHSQFKSRETPNPVTVQGSINLWWDCFWLTFILFEHLLLLFWIHRGTLHNQAVSSPPAEGIDNLQKETKPPSLVLHQIDSQCDRCLPSSAFKTQ